MKAYRRESSGRREASVQEDTAAAILTAVFVTIFGMQPIEKKLVMDQMLQREPQTGSVQKRPSLLRLLTAPGRDIAAYVRTNGMRALYAGTIPLILRECLYITAVTVASPVVTQRVSDYNHDASASLRMAASTAGAFTVGAAAGMASAPFQTVSAMMKSEENKGRKMDSILRQIFKKGLGQGLHRLWFGAATRSVRTGCASILYFQARNVFRVIWPTPAEKNDASAG